MLQLGTALQSFNTHAAATTTHANSSAVQVATFNATVTHGLHTTVAWMQSNATALLAATAQPTPVNTALVSAGLNSVLAVASEASSAATNATRVSEQLASMDASLQLAASVSQHLQALDANVIRLPSDVLTLPAVATNVVSSTRDVLSNASTWHGFVLQLHSHLTNPSLVHASSRLHTVNAAVTSSHGTSDPVDRWGRACGATGWACVDAGAWHHITAAAGTTIPALATASAAVSLSSDVAASLGSGAASASAAMVPSATTTKVVGFDASSASAQVGLNRLSEDLRALSRGFCTSSTDTLCDADADCPSGGTCMSTGTRRCRKTPSTTCSADSDCTNADDACLVDATRVAALSASLDALAISPASTFTTLFSSFAAAATSIDTTSSALDTVTLPSVADVVTANAYVALEVWGSMIRVSVNACHLRAADAMVCPTLVCLLVWCRPKCAFRSCFSLVQSSADMQWSDTKAAVGAVGSTAAMLASAASLSSAPLAATSSVLQPLLASISNTTTLVTALAQVFMQDLPSHMESLQGIGPAALSAGTAPVSALGGQSITALKLLGLCTVGNAVAAALNQSSFLPVEQVCPPQQARRAADVAAVLTSEFYVDQGPLFFFAALRNVSRLVLPGQSEASIWHDRQGATYVTRFTVC